MEIIPVQISKDGAPTPLSVVGPLFISSLLFHLSRTLLGAWHFSLFHSVYSSFHKRLDHIREPAFYWVFYFIFSIILVGFIIYIYDETNKDNWGNKISKICKNEKVLFVLVQ